MHSLKVLNEPDKLGNASGDSFTKNQFLFPHTVFFQLCPNVFAFFGHFCMKPVKPKVTNSGSGEMGWGVRGGAGRPKSRWPWLSAGLHNLAEPKREKSAALNPPLISDEHFLCCLQKWFWTKQRSVLPMSSVSPLSLDSEQ